MASETCDYFGLLSNSDSDDVGETSVHQLDEIIINTYKESDVDYGPTPKKIVEMPKRKRNDNYVHKNLENQLTIKKLKIPELENTKTFNSANTVDTINHKSLLLTNSNGQKSLNGHKNCVNKVQWSCTNLLLSASMDKSLKIWDGHQENPISVLNVHSEAVRCASWNVDGSKILSGGYDKFAKVTDISSEQEISKFTHENFVSVVQWKPNEENIFISGSLGVLYSWDLRCGDKPVRTYSYNCGQVLDIAFLPGGNELVCSGDIVTQDSADRTIMAWDFESTAILSNQIYQERYTCPHLIVHPKGQHFVAQTNGDYIAQFSTCRPYKMDKRKRFEGHKVSGFSIGCTFSNDGRYLYSGSSDGNIFCYIFENCRIRRRISIFPREPIMSISNHPSLDNTISVGCWSGKIHTLHTNLY